MVHTHSACTQYDRVGSHDLALNGTLRAGAKRADGPTKQNQKTKENDTSLRKTGTSGGGQPLGPKWTAPQGSRQRPYRRYWLTKRQIWWDVRRAGGG